MTLSHFIFKARDKGLPFLQLLRRSETFKWIDQCEDSFQQLKRYLAKLPLLTKPEVRERLYVYLAVSKETISLILVKEVQGTQLLVYYVSKGLQEPKLRYEEKLVLALVNTARRL